MLVKLTPAGEEAVWSWVQTLAKDPDPQQQTDWLKRAHKDINQMEFGSGETAMVWMRGGDSRTGHLHALRLKPTWYHVRERYRHALPD